MGSEMCIRDRDSSCSAEFLFYTKGRLLPHARQRLIQQLLEKKDPETIAHLWLRVIEDGVGEEPTSLADLQEAAATGLPLALIALAHRLTRAVDRYAYFHAGCLIGKLMEDMRVVDEASPHSHAYWKRALDQFALPDGKLEEGAEALDNVLHGIQERGITVRRFALVNSCLPGGQ